MPNSCRNWAGASGGGQRQPAYCTRHIGPRSTAALASEGTTEEISEVVTARPVRVGAAVPDGRADGALGGVLPPGSDPPLEAALSRYWRVCSSKACSSQNADVGDLFTAPTLAELAASVQPVASEQAQVVPAGQIPAGAYEECRRADTAPTTSGPALSGSLRGQIPPARAAARSSCSNGAQAPPTSTRLAWWRAGLRPG